MGIISRSLTGKLVSVIVLVALLPSSLIACFAFYLMRKAVYESEAEKLQSARDNRKRELMAMLGEVELNVVFLASVPSVRQAFEVIAGDGSSTRAADADHATRKQDQYNKIEAAVGEMFMQWQWMYFAKNGCRDILMMSPTGRVVYTLKQDSDKGANLKTGPLKDSGLGRACDKAMQSAAPVLEDFAFYKPANAPSAFVAVPVWGQDKTLLGVLAVQIGHEAIDDIFSLTENLGKTGKVYIAGQDFLTRSNYGLEATPEILKTKVDTEGVREALAGNAATKTILNSLGVPVLCSYTPAGIKKSGTLGGDFEWALVAEEGISQVESHTKSLAIYSASFGFTVTILVSALAVFLSRRISKPISVMAKIANDFSRGDLTATVPELKRDDEIGVLGGSFKCMALNLREQIGKIQTIVEVLSELAGEIAGAVTQVTTSTLQTVSAVAETVATVEQVRRSARVASDKSMAMTNDAQEAVVVAEIGKQATESTLLKMHVIRQQMESIAETVGRLSEHAQSIEAIIGSVKDLADQSKLLAVNASLEAARAGEHGKGFAVVAHEIKSLADQSKNSTDQVRSILNDTRKWVAAVVLATEQGGKDVQAGVDQSQQAGIAISKVSGTVLSSSQSAAVIQKTSDQQFAGVEQISDCMASIDQNMHEISASTVKLEAAVQRLAELGESLEELVRQYML